MRKGRRARGDDAAAAVEFALLLPFLAVLVCGVIDLGRWYSASNEARNAAREGAQYAQTFPNQQRPRAGTACASPNNIQDRARQELGSSASADFEIETTPAVPSCNPASGFVVEPGDTITVTVTRDVALITPIMRNLMGDISIKASVVAKVQG